MTRFLLVAMTLVWAASAADLPVKQVVLYKNGVGYFERSGEVAAGEPARLQFKASEMNDVLKSLTVEDRSGKVVSLRYDSSEPVEQKLREFPFQLGSRQPLAVFLDELKGARIELKTPSGAVAGAIAGGRVVAGGEQRPEQQLVTLLADSGELQSFDLAAVSGLRLADPQLQGQLKEYLAVLGQARSKEKKTVTIESTAGGARQMAASYMVPAPVWKSSYRLIFRAAEDPTIEGWAIVDNTSGEDWTGVQLALVSGRPTSFVSRLYEPTYRNRPTVELPEDRVQGPVLYEGATAGGVIGGVLGSARAKTMREMPAVMAAPPPPAPIELRADAASSIAAVAEARELGDLFEYRFASPVTVRKGESAMLPFVQQKTRARKLLVFSESQGQNPMNAAEIVNSTGKTLDGGPITVFETGAYSGEALMETLKAGDKRLIGYAVDLGTRVGTVPDSEAQGIREIHLRRGTLTLREAVRETKTYTVRNVDQKAKTLFIEHPLRPGYKVLSPAPVETTANRHRFELALAPASTSKLAVVEENTYEVVHAITDLSPDTLLLYARNKSLSEVARAQMEKVASIRKTIADNDRAIARTEKEIQELNQDQDRLRQNINSLNRVAGQQDQVQRYAQALAGQETKLAALRDRLSELRKTREVNVAALNAVIDKIEF
jgi:septum formation inhibitor MinC